jgi:hypothetical protein
MFIGDASFDADALAHHLVNEICRLETPFGDIIIRRGRWIMDEKKARYWVFAPKFRFGGGMYDEANLVKVVNSLLEQAIIDASLRATR